MFVNYEKYTGHHIVGVGVDVPSLDYGQSKTFKSHVEILGANIYGLENVANLDVSIQYNTWNYLFFMHLYHIC